MLRRDIGKAKDRRGDRTWRQFLWRVAGLAAVFVGLSAVGHGAMAGEGAGWDEWESLGTLPGASSSADRGAQGARIADWSSLSGGLTTRPAVGRNEDGRLEVFARGDDNALWQIWQVAPNGGWSGWNSLGGYVTSNTAVSNNLDGRLEVFVRGTDNSLFHRWQTTPNGDWSGYSRLDGILTSDPTVAKNWDGRMEVFVRNTANGVSHRWQVAPNGGWSGWENFADTPGKVTGNIAAIATNAGGGMNLFWRATDGRLYWKRQTVANGAWGAPRKLGGPMIASEIAVGEFDGQRSDPRLVVFVRGTDNVIWYRAQTQPNSDTWTNWLSLGGPFTGSVAVASNWDGRLELFVRAPNGALYHNWQTQTDSGGSWSGWVSLGGYLTSDPVVGTNLDRRLEVFALGGDRALWHRWQVTPGGGWS